MTGQKEVQALVCFARGEDEGEKKARKQQQEEKERETQQRADESTGFHLFEVKHSRARWSTAKRVAFKNNGPLQWPDQIENDCRRRRTVVAAASVLAVFAASLNDVNDQSHSLPNTAVSLL